MSTLVTSLERNWTDQLPAYAWPGGYPLVYYTNQGATLCAPCATEELDTWIDADWRGPTSSNPYLVNQEDRHWYDGPKWVDVHYEGTEYCAQCDKVMLGAYEDDLE